MILYYGIFNSYVIQFFSFYMNERKETHEAWESANWTKFAEVFATLDRRNYIKLREKSVSIIYLCNKSGYIDIVAWAPLNEKIQHWEAIKTNKYFHIKPLRLFKDCFNHRDNNFGLFPASETQEDESEQRTNSSSPSPSSPPAGYMCVERPGRRLFPRTLVAFSPLPLDFVSGTLVKRVRAHPKKEEESADSEKGRREGIANAVGMVGWSRRVG